MVMAPVKGGKVQTEQMFSGLHLKADARAFTREEPQAPREALNSRERTQRFCPPCAA